MRSSMKSMANRDKYPKVLKIAFIALAVTAAFLAEYALLVNVF